MNPKQFFTTILIIATVFFSGFSGKSQNNQDTISIVKGKFGYTYQQGNKIMNLKQLMYLTYPSNKEAFRLMRKSNNLRNASTVFGFAGGGCLGFALGYALARSLSYNSITMYYNPINRPLFFSFLGAGVGLIGIGIGFEIVAKSNLKEAIDVYNHDIKQKNSANLDLGLTSNGMMMKLNF